MPTPEGEQVIGGFTCQLDARAPSDGSPPVTAIRGKDDERFVRGELSDDRAEVQYLSQWGLVVVPISNFLWIVELPAAAKGKTK